MYAVIETGGKQYRVAEGDEIKVEKLTVESGKSVDFDKVLMLSNGNEVKVGRPFVEGAKVTAAVQDHGLGKKVKIIKFKRRKHHLKRQGHRQPFTALKIEKIIGV